MATTKTETTAAAVGGRPKRRGIVKRLCLLFVAGIVSAGILELGVRIFAPQPQSWLSIYVSDDELGFYRLEKNRDCLVDTGESRWRVFTDDRGFRVSGEAKGPRASDRPKCLVVGDSFTFGRGVNYEETFVGVLEKRPDQRFELINSGVGGWGPVQYAAFFEHALAKGLKPELVLLVTYVGNDFHDCVWDKSNVVQDGIIRNDGSLKAFIKRNFHTYRLLAATYHKMAGGRSPSNYGKLLKEMLDEKAWESGFLAKAETRYRAEMKRMRERCLKDDIPVVAAIIPPYAILANAADEDTSCVPVEKARAALADAGFEHVVNLQEVFAPHDARALYLEFDGHLTPKGHEIAAGALAEAMDKASGK